MVILLLVLAEESIKISPSEREMEGLGGKKRPNKICVSG